MRLAKVGANNDATAIVPGVLPDVAGISDSPTMELLAAAAASASTAPEAVARTVRHEAMRDLQQFQTMFRKSNEKNVEFPYLGDTSEEEEREEEEEDLQEEAEVEVVNDGNYPFDKRII